MGSPPRGARSGGHDSCHAARTAATCTLSRGGACCHGAALSASKFRRGAARQSAATSIGYFSNFFFPLLEGLEFTSAASATLPQPIVLSIRVVHSLFIRSYLQVCGAISVSICTCTLLLKLYLNTTTNDTPVNTCSPVFACCTYE